MATTYEIVDFRRLVSDWHNDFLPDVCGDGKMGFVESSGIVYVNTPPLDSSLMDKTLNFMSKRLKSIASEVVDSDGVVVLAREPKPVNNVLVQPILRFVESNMDKERVAHLSTRERSPEPPATQENQAKEAGHV